MKRLETSQEGKKQKISLIRTFLKDANVMILDEPTSALDQNGRKYLAEYLQQIKHDKIHYPFHT